MTFQKEDLLGEYNWAGATVPHAFNGEPSRRLFNRYNGEQVLFIINYFATQDEKFTLQDGHKMEEQIGNLPLEAKSEISVLNCLKGIKPHISSTP